MTITVTVYFLSELIVFWPGVYDRKVETVEIKLQVPGSLGGQIVHLEPSLRLLKNVKHASSGWA